MDLQQQVCSLELAKRLKELNCKQESVFYWVKQPNGKWLIMNRPDNWIKKGGTLESYWSIDFYSAFSASEIFSLLDQDITIPKGTKNVADYMAQYLIENDLLTP